MKKLSSTAVASIRNIYKANRINRNILAKYAEMVDGARASIEATETVVRNLTGGHTSDEFFCEKVVNVIDKDGNNVKSEKTGKQMVKTVVVMCDTLPEDIEMPGSQQTAEAAVIEATEETEE